MTFGHGQISTPTAAAADTTSDCRTVNGSIDRSSDEHCTPCTSSLPSQSPPASETAVDLAEAPASGRDYEQEGEEEDDLHSEDDLDEVGNAGELLEDFPTCRNRTATTTPAVPLTSSSSSSPLMHKVGNAGHPLASSYDSSHYIAPHHLSERRQQATATANQTREQPQPQKKQQQQHQQRGEATAIPRMKAGAITAGGLAPTTYMSLLTSSARAARAVGVIPATMHVAPPPPAPASSPQRRRQQREGEEEDYLSNNEGFVNGLPVSSTVSTTATPCSSLASSTTSTTLPSSRYSSTDSQRLLREWKSAQHDGRNISHSRGSTSSSNRHHHNDTSKFRNRADIKHHHGGISTNEGIMTMLSEEEDDVNEGKNDEQQKNRAESASTSSSCYEYPPSLVASLSARPMIVGLPDELDRKRMIGCLAGILASSYAYDVAQYEGDDATNNYDDGNSFYEGSEWQYSFNDDDQEDVASVDSSFYSVHGDVSTMSRVKEEERKAKNTEGDGQGILLRTSSEGDLDVHNRFYRGEELGQSSAAPSSFDEGDDRDRQSRRVEERTAHERQGSRVLKTSASFGEDNRLLRQWGDKIKQPQPQGGLEQSLKKLDQKQMQQNRRVVAKRVSRSRIGRRKREGAAIAAQRHRRRRHEMYSDLLLSAATSLMLDEFHARAFLPMLQRLQFPEPPPPEKREPSSRPKERSGRLRRSGGKTKNGVDRGMGEEEVYNRASKDDSVLGSDLLIRSIYQSAQQQSESCVVEDAEQAGRVDSTRKPPVRTQSSPELDSSAAAGTLLETWPSARETLPVQLAPVSMEMDDFGLGSGSKLLAPTRSPDEDVCDSPGTLSSDDEVEKVGCAPDLERNESLAVEKNDKKCAENRESINAAGLKSGKDKGCSLVDRYDDNNIIQPFLDSLSPGAGFQCISLLLLQHLLRSEEGYDARVRHAFKKLAIVVLVHEMKNYDYGDDESELFENNLSTATGTSGPSSPSGSDNNRLETDVLVERATRKFEALEHGIALKLIKLSEAQQSQDSGRKGTNKSESKGHIVRKRQTLSRDHIMRGLKIGSAGVLAGTIFAVTGGLAAPGIAAGIAAMTAAAGSTAAVTAAVATLTSTAAVTAIFGVGGGGLAAYKMQRRTKGLTEFDFQKESGRSAVTNRGNESKEVRQQEAELFSTICLSGWLRDKFDFQRPWGVTPTNPRLVNKLELLERFYYIHKPENVARCSSILRQWKGSERKLWRLLREKYGRDPDHLFPLDSGPRTKAALTHEEDEVLDKLFEELGYAPLRKKFNENIYRQQFDKNKDGWKQRLSRGHGFSHSNIDSTVNPPGRTDHFEDSMIASSYRMSSLMKKDSLHGPCVDTFAETLPHRPIGSSTSAGQASGSVAASKESAQNAAKSSDQDQPSGMPKHLMTVWDYRSIYGGELYTVRWESDLLMDLCDSVTDLAVEVLSNATKELLKQTALATLMTAIALPVALVNAAGFIDGTWTLAIERADEAGVELAKSLLYSRAGHRPVTLVGFSMGARTIYSCLKELARCQELWEEEREQKIRNRLLRRSDGMQEQDDIMDSNSKKKSTNRAEEGLEHMREPASIVEDAILMGTPNHLSLSSWEACRRVVAGRLVNCYSRKDWILSLMFQYKRFAGRLRPICGTSAVTVPGVENYNVTDLVSSHTDYCLVAGEILKRVRHGQPRPVKHSNTDEAVEESVMENEVELAKEEMIGTSGSAQVVVPLANELNSR